MIYLLVFFTSFIATLFLTPYFISLLKKASIVDIPGGRKLHSSKIPRMGGLIIFIVVLAILNTFIDNFESLELILISITILILSGIIDDVIGLNSFIKFILQNIAAVILILYFQSKYSSVELFGFTLSEPFNYLILLLFIVGAINSINLLDGLDGLASGFSLLIFAIILALAINRSDAFLILLSVSLIGSLIGFLRFNAFPASIFLGDTGAYILGFFLVLTSFLVTIDYNNRVLDITFPIMLLGIPLIDTVKVFFVRIVNRKNPFEPDTGHQHYILYKNNIKHELSVFLIEIFTLVYIVLAIFYLQGIKIPALILFVFFTVLLLLLEPFLDALKLSVRVNYLLKRIKSLQIGGLKPTLRILIYLSTLLIGFISIFSFAVKTSLNIEELVFLIIATITLLVLAGMQFRESQMVAHINVFLNFTIFFIVSKLSIPLFSNAEFNFSTLMPLHDLSFYVLVIFIIFMLLIRWKIYEGRKILFTGIDLTLIVVILLTVIVNNILEFDFNKYLSVSLLEAFIFYVWFKIAYDLKPKIGLILAFSSFLLPITLLSVLFFVKIF